MMDASDRCVLAHRGFLLLQDVAFQRSEADGVPVAMMPLGGRIASIPLRALQRELGIVDDSDDGRMLALIAESLDYVVSLRPGDKLPAEVLSGEASWQPAIRHLNAARTKLRRGVLAWAGGGDLAAALVLAAAEIGAADGDGAAAALESLAVELSFIEASRELLLGRVETLRDRLERLRLDSILGVRRDELTRSRRLIDTAIERISEHLADVDGHTASVLPALRRVEALRTYIRSNRDWLHRSRLAWEPVLKGWDRERQAKPDTRAALVSLTYRFLAQRFMTVQEWRSVESRRTAALRPEAVLQW